MSFKPTSPYLFMSAFIIYLANLGTFQTTDMLSGKYRIVLLLYLAYPISGATAGLPAKHSDVAPPIGH